jgi:hypothetical protein
MSPSTNTATPIRGHYLADETQSEYLCVWDRHGPDTPVFCGVCREAMTREATQQGAFAIYVCQHRHEDWHRQVAALWRAARETPSRDLEAMFREEANQVRHTRVATKRLPEGA